MVTRHAAIRKQQRGFTDLHLQLLQIFGEEVNARGGAVEVTISKRKRSEIIQALDKVVHKALIISEDSGSIITAYNKV